MVLPNAFLSLTYSRVNSNAASIVAAAWTPIRSRSLGNSPISIPKPLLTPASPPRTADAGTRRSSKNNSAVS